jgi:hypothetical protein
VQAGPQAVEKFQREHPEVFSAKFAELSAEKSADVRRKNPPTGSANLADVSAKSAEVQNPQSLQVFAAANQLSAEKSADVSAKFADKLIASLAVPVQKAKLAISLASAEKSADGSATAQPAAARAWVKSVDRLGQLEDPLYGPQWERLCLEYPNYVLIKLKRRFEMEEDRNPGKISDPLAYLARKAREEGRMRR